MARFTVVSTGTVVPDLPHAVFDHERGHVALADDPDGPRTGPLAYFATRAAAHTWIRAHTPAAPPARPPRGTRVRYHGTSTDLHGEYLYDGLCGCDMTDDYDDGCDDDYPNRHQLAYDEPAGPDGRRRALIHVRRDSFTPVAETPSAETKE